MAGNAFLTNQWYAVAMRRILARKRAAEAGPAIVA